jgi:hypothetical protein
VLREDKQNKQNKTNKQANTQMMAPPIVLCLVRGPQVLCWLRCRRCFICFVAAGAFFVLLPQAFSLFVTLPQVLSLFRCRRCFLCFVAAGASFICFVSFSSSTRPPGRPPVRPGGGGEPKHQQTNV